MKPNDVQHQHHFNTHFGTSLTGGLLNKLHRDGELMPSEDEIPRKSVPALIKCPPQRTKKG